MTQCGIGQTDPPRLASLVTKWVTKSTRWEYISTKWATETAKGATGPVSIKRWKT